MSVISKPYTFSAGAVIVAAEHNSNFDTIYSDYNGNITNANVASGASIADTKLATISTTGKVNISALTVASQAQGDVIYASSASAWARLGPGTSGQYLKTQGAAANPIWADLAYTTANLPSGTVLQFQYQLNVTKSTGTTVIPLDDTIPQNTEGDEYLTKAITPYNASNILRIDVVLYGDASAGGTIQMALFQDSTANALSAVGSTVSGGNLNGPLVLTHLMAAGTTSATTFKVRAGGTAGTFTINGFGGNRIYGGVLGSSICITEIKA